MRKINKIVILSIAFLAIAFVNVDAQSFTGDVTAVQMEKDVRKQILKLPYYEVFDHIEYSIQGNTVVLDGKVRNATNQRAAEAAVKRVSGVEVVVNNIDVLPIGGFDDRIRRELLRSVASTAGLSRYLWPVNPSIRLVVERGHVTLEGFVTNETDLDLANIAARSVSGVFSVTNNLVVNSEKAR